MPPERKPMDMEERWLLALEKEKVWNRKREDVEDRIGERKQTWGRLLGLLEGDVIFDSSKRILDIGCEATSIFLALREGKKFAADPLIEYLFHLHPFLREIEEYKDVNFISSPIEDIAPDKRFDIIFFLAALDHIGDLKPVIEKIDSLLVPSGILIIMVDCYADSLVQKIMSSFDVELYHPHHFVAADTIGLFPGYRLRKQRQIFDIYRDIPFGGQRIKLEVYRVDRLIARMWNLLGEWGKRGDIVFAVKFFMCYGLSLLVASLRRRDRPIHPLKKPNLFVFQKP